MKEFVNGKYKWQSENMAFTNEKCHEITNPVTT
jgi:hypothetical protein